MKNYRIKKKLEISSLIFRVIFFTRTAVHSRKNLQFNKLNLFQLALKILYLRWLWHLVIVRTKNTTEERNTITETTMKTTQRKVINIGSDFYKVFKLEFQKPNYTLKTNLPTARCLRFRNQFLWSSIWQHRRSKIPHSWNLSLTPFSISPQARNQRVGTRSSAIYHSKTTPIYDFLHPKVNNLDVGSLRYQNNVSGMPSTSTIWDNNPRNALAIKFQSKMLLEHFRSHQLILSLYFWHLEFSTLFFLSKNMYSSSIMLSNHLELRDISSLVEFAHSTVPSVLFAFAEQKAKSKTCTSTWCLGLGYAHYTHSYRHSLINQNRITQKRFFHTIIPRIGLFYYATRSVDGLANMFSLGFACVQRVV